MQPIDLPAEQSIDFRTSYYFPLLARVGAWIFIAVGVSFLPVNLLAAAFFILVGIFVVTTQYRLKIDFGRNQYKNYSRIFWLPFESDSDHFDQIEYIYINKNKVTQRVYARVASTTLERYDYNAYLKFSERLKIHLHSDGDKDWVVRHAQALATKLKCDVLDRTNED